MKVFNLSLIVLSFLLLAAHFLRMDLMVLMVISVVSPFLLFYRKKRISFLLQFFLFLGALEWIRSIIEIINYRLDTGQDWMLMLIILTCVVLVTLYAALSIRSKSIKDHFNR